MRLEAPSDHLLNEFVAEFINFGTGGLCWSTWPFAWQIHNEINQFWRWWALRLEVIICFIEPQWDLSILQPVRLEPPNDLLLAEFLMKSIHVEADGLHDSKQSFVYLILNETYSFRSRWALKLQVAICLTNSSWNLSILEPVGLEVARGGAIRLCQAIT